MVVVVALDDVIIHLCKCICQVGCRKKLYQGLSFVLCRLYTCAGVRIWI
nr:MAG TPA_asm: hypothetical protein [Bacteriophage sp.]